MRGLHTGRTSGKLQEKFEQIKFEAKMEQLKASLTELIEIKVEKAMKIITANVEDSYAKIVARRFAKIDTSNSKKDNK